MEGKIPELRGSLVVGHVSQNPPELGVGHLLVGRLPGQSRSGPVKGPVHTPLAAALAPRGRDALRMKNRCRQKKVVTIF